MRFLIRDKAGDRYLQAVVIDENLIPSRSMHLLVYLDHVNAWFRCNDVRESFKEGGNKRWVHVLGFQSVDQEKLEVDHQAGLYNHNGGHRTARESSHFLQPS